MKKRKEEEKQKLIDMTPIHHVKRHTAKSDNASQKEDKKGK